MEGDLISKKELLSLTGISYGQLYRWKRKNLIPEEWFIRKSAYTGQETFFPKDKILTRINKITNMKNELSLDELADMLSPNPKDSTLTREELLNRNIVSKETLDYYVESQGAIAIFSFEKIVHLHLFEKLLREGHISLTEGKNLLQTLNEHYAKFDGQNCDLIFLRKMGVSLFLLVSHPNKVYFESDAKMVTKINVASCIEELKPKLT